MNEEIITKAKILALRDVEIQMYRIIEKGEIISFDNVKEVLVVLEELYKLEEKMPKEPKCEYGHDCTSDCRRSGCACEEEHCCSRSSEKCGETDSCELCASLVPDLADKINDEIYDK